MQVPLDTLAMLGVFNLGGGEIILLLALVWIFFQADNLPRILQRLWGDDARDAGRSFGGIFGKRAAQALTPDNEVAELYSPGRFQRPPKRRTRFKNALSKLWRWIRSRMGWA